MFDVEQVVDPGEFDLHRDIAEMLTESNSSV